MGRDPHPFLVPPDCIGPDGTVRFPESEAHHLRTVVRLRPGEICRVVDGKGGLYRVRLERGAEGIIGRIEDSIVEDPPAVRLDLGFPVLRHPGRAAWLIEKAVEVGVRGFIPIRWSRAVRRMTASQARRWERIAQEAMKQSERRWMPVIADEIAPEEIPADARLLLADPAGGSAVPALPSAGRVLLLVGPEGGVDEEERNRLLARGAVLWGLGPARLRAETAAIVGSHRLAVDLGAAGQGIAVREGGV